MYINTLNTVSKGLSYCLKPTNNSDYNKEVRAGRAVGALGCMLSVPCAAVDAVMGIFTGVVSLGLNKNVNSLSLNHLRTFQCLFSNFYFVGALLSSEDVNETLDKEKHGFIADIVTKKFDEFGSDCLKGHWAMRNIVARLSYSLMLPAMVISRIADGALAPFLVVASLVTRGKYKGLNNAAFGALQMTGLLRDIFYCAFQVVIPREYTLTGKYIRN